VIRIGDSPSSTRKSSFHFDGAANRGKHFQAVKDKKIIMSSQHGFSEGKSCLISLNFSDEMAGLVDKGTVVDIGYLDFTKAFDTVSCKILIVKLLK